MPSYMCTMKLSSFLLESLPLDEMEYAVSEAVSEPYAQEKPPTVEKTFPSQDHVSSVTETTSMATFDFIEDDIDDLDDMNDLDLIDDDDVKVTALFNIDQFYVLILPIATAALILLLFLLMMVIRIIIRGRKLKDKSGRGPSIVVYPSQKGAGPQFLTKEIRFSLPVLRQACSMGDLITTTDDATSIQDLDPLIPSSLAHSQRSNSFSCYGLGSIDPALYRDALDFEEELGFPEGHLGRLWFSLRYEASTEKLLLSLMKAKNLPSRSLGTVNSCDPVVRMHLLPDERRYQQSKQKKKTCNPFFDESFIFQVPSKELDDHILKFTVIDAGRTKKRSLIGHISFPLRNIPADGEQRLYKLDLEKEVQEVISDNGELLVSLLYNENLQRLTVTVLDARRLKFRDEKQDSYVRVILKHHYRTVKMKRTSTVKGTDSPNFSQCFNFTIQTAQIDVTSINFHVYQTVSSYGRDKLIGKFVIGSYMFARGKALSHWTSAFSSPMEQVQLWHALSE